MLIRTILIFSPSQDHKKWSETVTELYRTLGYPDSKAFLEAYGYIIEKNAGRRSTSVDPVSVMEELHRRYPNGGAESLDALKRDNPDIPWKTLSNNAKEYFGETLVKAFEGGMDSVTEYHQYYRIGKNCSLPLVQKWLWLGIALSYRLYPLPRHVAHVGPCHGR